MKKILMVLLVAAIVAGFAFAEGPSAEPSVTLSAEVSTTFGIDLDNSTSGFKNSAEANLELIFGDEADVEMTGEGVYGYIKIEDAELSNGDGNVFDGTAWTEDELLVFTTGDIVGKVVFGSGYVLLWDGGAPSTEVNEASVVYSARVDAYDELVRYGEFEDADADDTGDLWIDWYDVFSSFEPTAESGGIEVGYTFDDMLTAGFVLTSAYAWDNAATFEGGLLEEDANAYNLKPFVEVTAVENLTINASAGFAFGYDLDQPMGFGVNADYEFVLDDTFSLVPAAGFDYYVTEVDGDSNSYALEGGVHLKWPGTWDDDADNAMFEERDVFSGATVGFLYAYDGDALVDTADLALNVSAWEDTEEGLVPNLGFAFAFEMANLLNEFTPVAIPAMQAFVDYKIDNITPFFGVNYIFEAEDGGTIYQDEEMFLKAGVDIADIIPMCSLGLYWDSNEMKNGVGVNEDKMGAFTTEFTIEF